MNSKRRAALEILVELPEQQQELLQRKIAMTKHSRINEEELSAWRFKISKITKINETNMIRISQFCCAKECIVWIGECFQTNVCLQKSVSIQPRTGPFKALEAVGTRYRYSHQNPTMTILPTSMTRSAPELLRAHQQITSTFCKRSASSFLKVDCIADMYAFIHNQLRIL